MERLTSLVDPAWVAFYGTQTWLFVRSGSWQIVKNIVPFFVLFYLLDVYRGGDRTRYRSRHFLNEILYGVVYHGGFYRLLFFVPVVTALKPLFTPLNIQLFAPLPLPVSLLSAWLIIDLATYWVHRLCHANRFLWAFHAIHHTQTRMSFLTTQRFHVVDSLAFAIGLGIPVWILGIPEVTWFPVLLLTELQQQAAHADLPWRFGALYRVVTSPVFHAIHHSADPAHADKNFARCLSLWDFLFGTAVDGQRPTTFGVQGLDMPETLFGQFFAPFRLLRKLPAQTAGLRPDPSHTMHT